MTTPPQCQCPFICGEHPRADPRVVSGTDAVAATPEPAMSKMTMCDALNAFEVIRDFTRVGEAVHGIAILAVQRIRADGVDGASVPKPEPGSLWTSHADPGSVDIKVNQDVTAEQVREAVAAVQSRAAAFAGAPAAPAPGVGEGPRELTFAEAMALDPSQVDVQLYDGTGTNWHPLETYLNLPLRELRAHGYRLRPEPLPAPAPRVSRAVQMARNLFDGPGAKWVGPDEMEQHFAAVARETFACIKHFGGDLDRARDAMLETR